MATNLDLATLREILGPDFPVTREEQEFIRAILPNGHEALIEELTTARFTIWMFENAQAGKMRPVFKDNQILWELSEQGKADAEKIIDQHKFNTRHKRN